MFLQRWPFLPGIVTSAHCGTHCALGAAFAGMCVVVVTNDTSSISHLRASIVRARRSAAPQVESHNVANSSDASFNPPPLAARWSPPTTSFFLYYPRLYSVVASFSVLHSESGVRGLAACTVLFFCGSVFRSVRIRWMNVWIGFRVHGSWSWTWRPESTLLVSSAGTYYVLNRHIFTRTAPSSLL